MTVTSKVSPKSAEKAKRKYEDELEVSPSKRTRSSGTASFFVPLEGAPGVKPEFVASTPRRHSQPSNSAQSSPKSSHLAQKTRPSGSDSDVPPPMTRSEKTLRSSRKTRRSDTDQEMPSSPSQTSRASLRKLTAMDMDLDPMPRIADESRVQAPVTPNANRHNDIADRDSISSSGRPRYFMEAVEIRTPRSLTKAGPSRSLSSLGHISLSQSSSRPKTYRKPSRRIVLSEDEDHDNDELLLVPQSSKYVARLSTTSEALQTRSPSTKSATMALSSALKSDDVVYRRRSMASAVSNSPLKSSPLKKARIASPEVEDPYVHPIHSSTQAEGYCSPE